MQPTLQMKKRRPGGRRGQHQVGSWVRLALSASRQPPFLTGAREGGGVRGWCRADLPPSPHIVSHRDSMDSVKQSAALCLLRLYKASPDLVPMGEWTARVVHLLNDQHMVGPAPVPRHVPTPWAPACMPRAPTSVPDTHPAAQGSCPLSPAPITRLAKDAALWSRPQSSQSLYSPAHLCSSPRTWASGGPSDPQVSAGHGRRAPPTPPTTHPARSWVSALRSWTLVPGLPSHRALTCPSAPQGVVTAAVSLITCLCKKNPDDFKTCISLAVSRLSRVRVVLALAAGGGPGVPVLWATCLVSPDLPERQPSLVAVNML